MARWIMFPTSRHALSRVLVEPYYGLDLVLFFNDPLGNVRQE